MFSQGITRAIMPYMKIKTIRPLPFLNPINHFAIFFNLWIKLTVVCELVVRQILPSILGFLVLILRQPKRQSEFSKASPLVKDRIENKKIMVDTPTVLPLRPVVLTTVSLNFLQPFQIFTQFAVKGTRGRYLNKKLHKPLRRSFVKVNIGLFQYNVGKPSTNTFDGGHGEHDFTFAINVGTEDTQDVLKLFWDDQRLKNTNQ
ncbi:hypothetical protein AGLY_006643 [Aphis glycines]|uniref:Uncharacterized protein n=1 Tax=Aphis glycines TaxID=307491 RepID=A0A6G0TRL9_APHGL|nr:hypothetical protein AGLY_006643 [Aphis glycines]